MLRYGPLVSEFDWCQRWGPQSAWCPNPVIGGPVPPPPGSAAYGIAVSELLMPLTIQVGDIIRRRPTVQPSARAKPPPSRRMMSHGIMR